jgi:glutamate carboxypeptidase
MRASWLVSAAFALIGALVFTPAASAADDRVMAAVKACEPDARALHRRIVGIDSGTGDVAGLTAMATALRGELERIGGRVVNVPPVAPAVGDNLVATFTGTGRGRILLIAHMDTVFPKGTVATRPYRLDRDHAIGPGAGDDKSGIIAAVCALRVLHDIGFTDFARITLLLNSNEETGSIGTRGLIRDRAAESDVAINLERGVPPDGVLISRKGSAVLTFEVTGRQAHAGVEPEKGINAVIEASHQAIALGRLANPALETSVNVTVLESRGPFNVIPDRATLKADVRAFTAAEFDRVESGARRLAAETTVPGVQVKVSMERLFPPWPHLASTDALVKRAQTLYAEIGKTLTTASVGGAADVAFAAEAGIPAIDGFGIIGGGAHGPDDYADLATIVPRVYLLTRMLMDLGREPPARAATSR